MSTGIDTISASQLLSDKCVVDTCTQQRLASCDYRCVFKKVTWHYEEGSLTLRGCVPSFYLKQLLQELLRGIEHVEQLHNDVDVVSSTGLSSEQLK